MTAADFVPYAPLIQAGTTFAVGLAVAYIAWRQWKTATEKLALDLFDKRFEVYRTIADYYAEEWGPGDLYAQEMAQNTVYRAIRTASFLFDSTISNDMMEAFNMEEGSVQRKIMRDVYDRMGDYMRFDRPHRGIWRLRGRLLKRSLHRSIS